MSCLNVPAPLRDEAILLFHHPQDPAIDTQVGAQVQISAGPVPPTNICRPRGGEAPGRSTPVASRPPPLRRADSLRAGPLLCVSCGGRPGFFWFGCDKSVTDKGRY